MKRFSFHLQLKHIQLLFGAMILSGYLCPLHHIQTPLPRVMVEGPLTSLWLFIFQFYRLNSDSGILCPLGQHFSRCNLHTGHLEFWLRHAEQGLRAVVQWAAQEHTWVGALSCGEHLFIPQRNDSRFALSAERGEWMLVSHFNSSWKIVWL